MFMFRSRRTTLTKRLTKVARRRRLSGGGADDCAASAHHLETLLRQLQENQLEMLLRAVEHGGSDCVLVMKDRAPPASPPPHLLCCQTWRWPEVKQASELRRLPSCRSASDPVYVCCNPYHWSRLCLPDSPPPPYSRYPAERLKPEDRAPSEAPLVCRNSYLGSVTTNGEGSALGPKVWCQLAYWELAQRVGPLFPVELPSVNVFGEDVYGNGLCIKTLAQHSFSPPDSVCRTRSKIGLGVTLSLEDDCVWVYNRSDNPIFINSLTLEDADSPSSPTRVPAEHCLCVYDPLKAAHQNYGWDFTSRYGPIDPNSIRISFVKGWGARYSRQEIKSCPCWLEILLVPCR